MASLLIRIRLGVTMSAGPYPMFLALLPFFSSQPGIRHELKLRIDWHYLQPSSDFLFDWGHGHRHLVGQPSRRRRRRHMLRCDSALQYLAQDAAILVDSNNQPGNPPPSCGLGSYSFVIPSAALKRSEWTVTRSSFASTHRTDGTLILVSAHPNVPSRGYAPTRLLMRVSRRYSSALR